MADHHFFREACVGERGFAVGIRVSPDSRGQCLDNVFMERLWRSPKHPAINLHEIAGGFTARRLAVPHETGIPLALNEQAKRSELGRQHPHARPRDVPIRIA